MMNMQVRRIEPFVTHEWLKYKHYAKRIPLIIYAFGLYDNQILKGVCTFGMPARAMNNGECIFKDYTVKTYELNRLVVDDNLPKNSLSFFVGQCLKMIVKPCCLVSYADTSNGHNGYIYQATNWTYTGLNKVHDRQIFLGDQEVHPRTAVQKSGSVKNFCKEYGATLGEYTHKHRYFKFLGSKSQKRKMMKHLKYDVLPYPKGKNKRYDSTYEPQSQMLLF